MANLSCPALDGPSALHVFCGALASAVSALTSLGNIFVLAAVVVSKTLRKKQTAYLIANLAIADLFVGAAVMPFSAMVQFNDGVWVLSRMTCRIWISLDVISCTASILTLMGISIDRLIGVTRPLHYNTIVTRRRICIGNALVWVVSVGILLATINWGTGNHFETPCPFCSVSEQLNYVLYSSIFSFYIPLLVVLSVYYKIYKVARQRERRMFLSAFYQALTISTRRGNEGLIPRPSMDEYSVIPLRMHCKRDSNRPTSYAKHKKSAKMLGIVIGAFVICWIPFFILHPADKLCNHCIPGEIMELFTWLGYANSAINPIIYALSMRSYAKAFRKLILRWQDSLLSCCFPGKAHHNYNTQCSLSRTSSYNASTMYRTKGERCTEPDAVSRVIMNQNLRRNVSNNSIGPSVETATTVKAKRIFPFKHRNILRTESTPRRLSIDLWKNAEDALDDSSSSWNLKLYRMLISNRCTEL